MSNRQSLRRLVAMLGCASALCATAWAQTTLYTPTGNATDDRFGTCLSSVGDLNADGKPEFIIGAPETGSVFSPREGYARVYNGATGASLYLFDGALTGDAFGSAVGASDVNADGKADLIVGAPKAGTSGNQAGKVYVFNGATGSLTPLWTFTGAAAGDNLGSAVAGAGDVNHDGYADVIAGAPTASTSKGMARVYSGKTGAILWTINGVANNDNLGYSVDGVGDVNNDLFDDFIVGSRLAGAKVYSGQTGAVLYTIAPVTNDRNGTSVAGCGDVNGDGRPDFIVGATQDGNIFGLGTGQAKVYSGLTGAVLWTLNGDVAGDRFGISVGGGKDVDGDGKMDLIVGADQNSSTTVGYARVFSGATGAPLYTVNNVNSGERYGSSVDLLGDVNADGKADFGVGAPATQIGSFTQAGLAKVYSATPSVPMFFESFCAGDNLDPNVTTACPCGNFGSAGRGCANSVVSAGAILFATGNPNPDTVTLTTSSMPSTASCIFLQGDGVTDGVFGDGVLCTGGSLIRLRSKMASAGSAQFPDTGDPLLSVRGVVTPGSGALRYYQTYYRNAAAAFCPPATFNVSNGWKITW